MSLSPQFLDELRARTVLSTLVGKSVKLQKAGREYKGCCPFHQEKTPSFYVNDDKGFYHCFGCSAHGDAIRWLTDHRGLPFMDAVKELAASAGMDVPAPDPRAAERQERAKGLHEAMADAQDWFVEQLNGISGSDARALIERRGLKPANVKAFGLGYSPDSKGKLKEQLKCYGDQLLIEAGLLISVEDKTPYDRFRGRLMIPIRDPRGRVIAFGGRVIGDGEPKYLNSPDTPLFDKGRTLYNLDRALPAARKADRVIVVEGYMDVIALAQAGIAEVVAPLGTALTEAQLERLWRISDVPILCFDGDAAGQKAALRAAQRALPMLAPGRSLQFVTLPQGQDPDDFIKTNGAIEFERLLLKPASLDQEIWRWELSVADVSTPDGRAVFKKRLEDWANVIVHRDLAHEYKRALLKRFFDLFGIGKDRAGRTQLDKLHEAVARANRHKGRGVSYSLKRAMLLGLMRHPSVIARCSQDLSSLRLGDDYLERWKHHLLDIADTHDVLTESLVDEILARSDIAPIDKRDYQRDLAFSFYRLSSEADVACNDLQQVIEIMLEEQQTKIAFDDAHADFMRTLSDEAFEHQRRCHLAALEATDRISDWLEQASVDAEAA